MIEATCLVVAV